MRIQWSCTSFKNYLGSAGLVALLSGIGCSSPQVANVPSKPSPQAMLPAVEKEGLKFQVLGAHPGENHQLTIEVVITNMQSDFRKVIVGNDVAKTVLSDSEGTSYKAAYFQFAGDKGVFDAGGKIPPSAPSKAVFIFEHVPSSINNLSSLVLGVMAEDDAGNLHDFPVALPGMPITSRPLVKSNSISFSW